MPEKKSTGIGKITVVFFSTPIDLRRAFPAAPVCPRKSPPEPHRDQKLSAAEAVEKKPSKRLQPVRYGALLRRQI